jgi:hypothetical protein
MNEDLLAVYISEAINELRLKRPGRSVGTKVVDKLSSYFSGKPIFGISSNAELDSSLESWLSELEIGYNTRLSSSKKRELRSAAQDVYDKLIDNGEDPSIAVKKAIRIMNARYARAFE